ncbi:hypothetical protein KKB18_11830 [bacterium]|nr:hypothetical protein [bacterium]
MKKKQVIFKTRDFSSITICLLSVTALVISVNFNFLSNDLSRNEITNELKLLVEAQKNYQQEFNTFATNFESLDYKGILEHEYLARAKKGYEFRLEYGGPNSFSFTANPKNPDVSNAYYYVDESGVIRYNFNSPANADSLPIGG